MTAAKDSPGATASSLLDERGWQRSHEFYAFMDSVKQEMASEYERISRLSGVDPGTAGDQAEENWASLLRDWLPATYPVVTKGRLINTKGDTSPQVDVLVLSPSYPRKLLGKKLYFAGGVVAAFECKLTLRRRDFARAFSNAVKIKRLIEHRAGSPFDELNQLPFFGLLAHSFESPGKKDRDSALWRCIGEYEVKFVEHPREMLDLICVANLATFVLNKGIHVRKFADKNGRQLMKEAGVTEGVSTMYLCQMEHERFKPIDLRGAIFGALISSLTRFIAYDDPMVQRFSEYVREAGVLGGIGRPITWDPAVIPRSILQILRRNGYEEGPWSRWQEYFDLL